MNVVRFRLTRLASLCGFALVFLSACATPQQYDPAGQNSGSPQNAPGTFLTDDPNAISGSVGQALSAYNTFTTTTTQLTVTSATTSTRYANQNVGTLPMETGYQLLIVNITLKNVSAGDAKSCPGGICTEYLSPLSNFRLYDDRNRPWYETTAALEPCSNNFRVSCEDRKWSDISRDGLAVGKSFTTRMAFKIPVDTHTYVLYFAPYRFPDIPVASTTAAATPTTTAGTVKATATAVPATTAVVTPATPLHPTLIKITLTI